MAANFNTTEVSMRYGITNITTFVIADDHSHQIDPASSAYLLHLSKDKGKSYKTVQNYGSTICILLNYLKKDPEIQTWDKLTDKQLRAYFEVVLPSQRGNSLSTINQTMTRIKKFYDYLYEYGWLANPPHFSWMVSENLRNELILEQAVKDSFDPYNLPAQYIPEQEFKTLLSYIHLQNQYKADRLDIILSLGYYSGFRRNETVRHENLKLPAINKAIKDANDKGKEGFHLVIIGKGQKTRTIYVPEILKQKIVRFINGPRANIPGENLICNPDGSCLNEQYATENFEATRANLIRNNGKHKTHWLNPHRNYHSLRHSYATNLAEYCKQTNTHTRILNDRLGHSDEATTWLYVHFNALLHQDNDTAKQAKEYLDGESNIKVFN